MEDLKQKVLATFQEKSKGEKKRFYVRDIVKWLPDADRKDVQNAIKALIDEEVLRYWSSGSTTFIMLPEFFPKE